MIYLGGVLLASVAVCVILWMRIRLLDDRIAVLRSRCNALIADKAMLAATIQGLRARLALERAVHASDIAAERDAATTAAAKAAKAHDMIANGHAADALDAALEDL